MAKPKNRSPWVVKLAGQPTKRFRLQSDAVLFLAECGHPDPMALPDGALTQLNTAFEVQIKRKDSEGKVVSRTQTFSTYKAAEKFAADQDKELNKILATHGGFEIGFETITVKEALEKFYKEHYEGTRSAKDIAYRIPYLVNWLDGERRFKDLTVRDFVKLRATLIEEKYSPSSQRNFFTVLTSLYRHAAAPTLWNFPVANLAANMDLPSPENFIERDWEGDEKERLMKSLALRSPWLIPIVEMSLEMAFRRGELVQGEKNKKTGLQSGGLTWSDIDWERGLLKLKTEKNDRSKAKTESKGRTVPITPKMKEILRPLYEANAKKGGLVFQGTTNSVSEAFANACARAEPPILGLTFHSLRKIATKALSRRVSNAMELRRLTGHKTIQVLDARYFKTTPEELGAKLLASSGAIRERGIAALTHTLGLEDAKIFLKQVRALKRLEDVFK